jgi:hypothetical protein
MCARPKTLLKTATPGNRCGIRHDADILYLADL